MNIIEQCRIIHDALQPTGDFPRSTKRLAEYLNLSVNKVYKLNFIHDKMVPELKEWFKTTTYQMSTAYGVAALEPTKQLEWLRETVSIMGGDLKPQDISQTNAATP